MKLSLKLRVVILLLLLTTIPIVLYVYHHFLIKEKVVEDRFKFNKLYASSIVSRMELFLERVMSEAEYLVYLYRNLGFSEEKTIWRITGQVGGVFEGAFYSPEGRLVKGVSRERIEPVFSEFLNFREGSGIIGVEYTEYKEPFLRFIVRDVKDGSLKGFFLFSLDLSLFWQSVASTRPSQSALVLLTDGDGNILAFSDMRFFSRRMKIPLREGIYRSEIVGKDVLGAYSLSKDGKWVVVVEEPVSAVLEPLQDFQKKAMVAGSAFMLSTGLFAILVFLRIFRPLENLKNWVVSWEKENIDRSVGVGDEVSELSQAFENLIKKLEEEKRLYFSLFENTLDGILVFNVERKVIDANRTVLEVFGVSREDVVGKTMEELIGEELPLSSMFFSEKKIKLGREVYCQLKQDILRVGKNLYVLWRILDVSRERELKVLLEQTAKLSMAGEIACSIAHQINNPLASIMAYAESIIVNTEDEEVVRKAEVIIRQAQKCAETVRKLLDVGRPFEGKPEYVKPENITMEVINILLHKAKRKKVKIEFSSSLNGEKVFTFPWQIEQVLLNVIDNAVDASPEGACVEVKLQHIDGRILWKVKDSGPGIPKEDVEKIFRPFYTTKDYGTGLGLPLAKRLVENMGGDLRIESDPGKGTVVYISINGRQDEDTGG